MCYDSIKRSLLSWYHHDDVAIWRLTDEDKDTIVYVQGAYAEIVDYAMSNPKFVSDDYETYGNIEKIHVRDISELNTYIPLLQEQAELERRLSEIKSKLRC